MSVYDSYKEAKEKILDAWRDFRIEINDYLPDGDPGLYMRFKDAYMYYEEFDAEDIGIMQKKFKAFADLVTCSIMGDHCRGDINRAYSDLQKAAEDKNLDETLMAAWNLFKELRITIIVLERLEFKNGRVYLRKRLFS